MPRLLKRSLYLLAGLSLALVLVCSWGAAPTGANSPIAPASSNSQALLEAGRSAYQAQQVDEAIAAWQAATRGFGQQGDDLRQALAFSYLSMAYQHQGNLSQAEAMLTRSLAQLERWRVSGVSHSAAALIIQGQVLNTQGALQFAQGTFATALESWQQAGQYYQQADDTRRYTGSLINQARALQALGHFLQARKALDKVQAQLDDAPPALRAIGLQSLGNTLRAIGDLDEAEKAYQQGLTAARSPDLAREATALRLSLGQLVQQQQRLDEALSFYRSAARTTPDQQQQAQAQVDEFGVLVATQSWTTAQRLAQSLQPQLRALPPSRTSLYLQARFAQHLMAFESPETLRQAADVLGGAARQAKALGDRQAEAYTMGYLGKVYEQAQQWDNAKTVTEDALLIAQSFNAADITYQWQWQLGRILKSQQKTDAAIAAYRGAFQSLQALRYDLAAIAPDQQFSFRKSVEPVYRDYVDLLLQPTDTSPEISSERLQQARQVIESLQVAELNNFFRSACIEGQVVALEAVDREGAAVIYPILLRDRLEVVVSLPDQPLQHHAISLSQAQVTQTVTALQSSLIQPFVTSASKALGEEIYRWLIQPIEAELHRYRVDTLVFVLDGPLRSVPMGALFDGDRYLIETYSIALTPGLQLVAPQPLQQQRLRTIAGGLTKARHGFEALDNVAVELEKVKATVPSRVLLNRGFTSETLRQQIEALPYPVVHLATHGQFSSRPEETFILTWDGRLGMNELTAMLRASDLSRQTPIELLILSACETATGDERAALGLAGIAVRAGARSTIASLWSVDDESGAVLMGHLYDELANANTSRTEALRRAQLALLKHPDYRAPFFWAPFVLVGNWL